MDSSDGEKWKAKLEELHHSLRLDVYHEPWTARYDRAQQALETLVEDGLVIAGKKDLILKCQIVVLWVWPDPEDIFGFDEFGKYAAVKIFEESLYAGVFAFYDGVNPTDDDSGNHRLTDIEEAKLLAKSFGYEVIE